MSTEVGSLQASLTLDLSNFRAGMSEAASLASELGMQLQSAFSGDTGINRMTAEVLELLAQIGNLRGAMASFQASLNTTTSADLFAQMRTHTSALPSEIASITSALQAANTAAAQLNTTMQSVTSSFNASAAAAQRVAGSGLGSSNFDFSAPSAQLEHMLSVLNQVIALMQKLNTIDLSTGEILGEGDQIPAFYNILTTVQQINEELERTVDFLDQCGASAKAWEDVMQRCAKYAARIDGSLAGSRTSASGIKSLFSGANAGAKRLVDQSGKASRNLQSAKGYALSLKGILGGIVISQAFYKMLNVMEQLVYGSIEFSENMQDAGVAFKYLMQDSTASSESFLNALKDIALQSPLDTTDLTSASRKLMAMGFSAEATVPALQILTDTAAVFSNGAGDMSDQIDHIALAFGQMIASGKVSAQELRQLYNAGLPIYQLLSDGLGITMEQAKNIGKYNIDSATAVFAVLEQLKVKYGGAAKALSMTMSGSLEVIKESIQQLISYGWSDVFDDLTQKVSHLANFLRALVKITQAYGPGGLFQALLPPSSWTMVRMCIGGLRQIGDAVKQLFIIVFKSFGGGLKIIVAVGSVVLPVLGTITQTIMLLARTALKASPALRLLLSMIAALIIAGAIAKLTVILAKAIWLLTGAKAAATAIAGLVKAFLALGAVQKGVVIALVAIAAAFLAIVASSEKAKAAIASFFKGVASKFNNFAQNLGMGFELDDIAMPKFDPPETGDFSDGLKDLTSDMEDLNGATEKAGKSAKKNLQSFDQVFTIDNEADDNGPADAMKNFMDSMGSLGKLDYSDLFDWTGDWASDWGNLSAGLGSLGENTGNVFGDMSNLASEFWQNLSKAFAADPEVFGGMLGGAIGAIIGGLLGGKGGAIIGAAIGALAGGVLAKLWKALADAIGLSDSAGLKATIGSGIGALIGAAIGAAFGHPLIGAAIGALAGGLISLIDSTIREKLGSTKFQSFSTALSTAMSGVISGVSKFVLSFASSSFKDALLSGLKGGVVGAIGGLVGGFLANVLTAWIAKEIGLSEQALNGAGVGQQLGSIVGGVIGTALGGPGLGTAIGAAAGSIIGSLEGLFFQPLQEAFGSAGSWGMVATSVGAVIGTVVTPGIGTAIGAGIGAIVGVTGGLIRDNWASLKLFFMETVPAFFTETIPTAFATFGEGITTAFSNMWEGVRVFFSETLPGWWDNFLAGLSSFITETIPNVLYDAGFAIGEALGNIALSLITFFTETIPNAWNNFLAALNTFLAVTIPNAWNNFVNALSIFFTVTIPNAWNNFLNALRNFFTVSIPNAWNNFLNALRTFFTVSIPNAWNSFLAALKRFFTSSIPSAWNNFKASLGRFFSGIISDVVKFFTVSLPAKWDAFIETVKGLGKRIIDGLLSGLRGAATAVWDWITSFGSGFIDGFKSVFKIHSPSKVTESFGEFLDLGLVQGLRGGMGELTKASQDVAGAIQDSLTPDSSITPDVQLNSLSSSTLNSLSSWSTTFVGILSDMFTSIYGMFDDLNAKLVGTGSTLANMPTAMSAKIGPISAADKLASNGTPPTGTQDVRQILADLTEATIGKLAATTATRIYEYLAPLFASLGASDQDRVLAYVGTLIADDKGLKDLENKLQIIRAKDASRRGR